MSICTDTKMNKVMTDIFYSVNEPIDSEETEIGVKQPSIELFALRKKRLSLHFPRFVKTSKCPNQISQICNNSNYV